MDRPLYKSWTPPLLLAIGLVATAFYYLIGGEEAHEIVNAIMCAVSLGVCIGFTANVLKVLARHPWEWQAEDSMILGIWISSFCLGLTFLGLWLFRFSDDGYWRTNVVFFVSRVGIIVGFTMMMTAAHSVQGKLPREAYLKAGKIITAAMAFALVMISLGYS